MLAELVKQGKLPPVTERVPKEPLVIKPVHEIGRYGGTWRRGFTGPGDSENGNRIVSADKLLFWEYTGTQHRPVRRAAVAPERRREVGDALPPEGPQVVGREALHRRRLRVLVRGRLPEQGPRADAAPGLHDQRQVRGHQEDRRDHGPLRVPGAELPVPRHPGRLDRDGRRAGALADGGPHDGRLHAGPLHQAVPPEVHRDGRREREGQGGELRRLGRVHQEPLGLDAQPRAARADAVEGDHAHQQPDLGDGAESVLLRGRHRGQPAPVHRPDPDDARREPRGAEPPGHRRPVRSPGAPHGHDQAPGVPREPGQGRLRRPARPGAERLRRHAPDQPLLRRGPRDRRSGSTPPTSGGRCRWASTGTS